MNPVPGRLAMIRQFEGHCGRPRGLCGSGHILIGSTVTDPTRHWPGRRRPVSVGASFNKPLVQINHDRDSILGIPAVIQVITIPGVLNIYIIVLVPVVSPVWGPRVKQADPIATVPKAGVPAKNVQIEAEESKNVAWTKKEAITVVWNSVAVVAATLLPSPVLALPVTRPIPLPRIPFVGSLHRRPIP